MNKLQSPAATEDLVARLVSCLTPSLPQWVNSWTLHYDLRSTGNTWSIYTAAEGSAFVIRVQDTLTVEEVTEILSLLQQAHYASSFEYFEHATLTVYPSGSYDFEVSGLFSPTLTFAFKTNLNIQGMVAYRAEPTDYIERKLGSLKQKALPVPQLAPSQTASSGWMMASPLSFA